MPAAPLTVPPIVVFLMLSLLASVVGSWIWVILRVAFQAPILPRFEPRVVPWGGKSVLAVLLVWLAVQVVGQIAFTMATHGVTGRVKGEPPVLSPSEMMVASAIQNTAVLVVIPLLLAAISQARARDFGLTGSTRKTLGQVAQGVVAWPLAAPLVYGMMLMAVAIWGKQNHPLESAIKNEGLGRMSAVFLLAGAILAPAAEELIFRGVLLGWLTRLALRRDSTRSFVLENPGETGELSMLDSQLEARPEPGLEFNDELRIDPGQRVADDPEFANLPVKDLATMPESGTTVRLILANLVVSVLFAGLHYSVWPTPVPIFFLSLVLGLLYQRTGSLVGPIALHMTFNGISTILMFLTIGLSPTEKANPSGPPPTPIPIPAPVPKPITTPASPIVRSWDIDGNLRPISANLERFPIDLNIGGKGGQAPLVPRLSQSPFPQPLHSEGNRSNCHQQLTKSYAVERNLATD